MISLLVSFRRHAMVIIEYVNKYNLLDILILPWMKLFCTVLNPRWYVWWSYRPTSSTLIFMMTFQPGDLLFQLIDIRLYQLTLSLSVGELGPNEPMLQLRSRRNEVFGPQFFLSVEGTRPIECIT